MAVTTLIKKVAEFAERKEYVVRTCLDVSKAFVCISHRILLNKLELYGIRGFTLKWFESYLLNRQQFVIGQNRKSIKLLNKFGVPQGSILGP